MGRAGAQSQGMGAGTGKWAGSVAMWVGACLLGFERREEPLYSRVLTRVHPPTHGMSVFLL